MTKARAGFWSRKPLVVAIAYLGIGVVGAVDYLTGVEYRVFPLYFLPLSFVAWNAGRTGGLAAAAVCALLWVGSNYAAGLRFSHAAVWVVNFFMQGASFVVVAVLIAYARSALQREAALARTDELTLLPNTRAFYQEAERILALGQRYGHAVTLAYIDLDNFKNVNDTLGHRGGDDLLRRVADRLRQCIRTGDVPARLGGDEFVLLLPETGPDGARAFLERLHSALVETLSPSPCPVTVSIGAVSFVAAPGDVDDLIQQADAQMYAAKSAGKNRVCVTVVGDSHEIGSRAAEAMSIRTPGSKPTVG